MMRVRRGAFGILVAAGLVGFAVGAFFLSLAYADMLYTLVALALALAKVTRTRVAQSAVAAARAPAGSWRPARWRTV